MGSLSELVAVAEHQDRVRNPLQGTLEKGISGFMGGMGMRQQAERSKLDTHLKMLEIAEKMQKMQAQSQEMQFQRNMGEAMGFMPMDDSKKASVTSTLFGMLGGEKNTPHVNTEMGKMHSPKMMDLIKSGQAKVHMDHGGKFSMTFGGNSGADGESASLKFQKEKYAEEKAEKESKSKVELAEKISSLNYKFAQRHLYQQMIAENPDLAGEQTLAKVVPSDDLMASFTRASELAATGKTVESDKLRAEVSKRATESYAVDKELKDLDGEMRLSKSQKARKAELQKMKGGVSGEADPAADFRNFMKGRK